MSETNPEAAVAAVPDESTTKTEPETTTKPMSSSRSNIPTAVSNIATPVSNIPTPVSNIPTPASSVTGIPVSRIKAPSNFGSTNSVSKIGRPCCNQTTPKAGPPPRDTNSMSRESDDNLSSINSAYTDLYQETVKRFTRSSLSPTSDWDRFSPARRSLKSTSTTPSTTTTSTYDYYLEATGRRRSSDHNSAVLTANTEQFIIGQRVWVGGLRSGQIAYIGETHFAPGDWAGIVLDEPNGKNDGCVSGKRYFQCEPKRGIFSRLTRLTTYPLSGAQTPTSPMAKNSPERSRTVSPTASVRSSMLRSPGIGKNGLTVGDRVIVSSGFGSRPGILRYLGETQFAPGNWCGVELDEASGKNDGAVDGIRYFECKPKYGVFVPIAKVSLSPSTKKTRLSRTGSRESLTSIGTMNSIATTNTSRMRMNAQRKSTTPIKPIVTTPKSQFSMQDLLREKQNHVEQLMVERDLDREDAQNQALQLQKNINELKARIVQLESQLSEERKKSEELQFSIDEAQFCGDELNAQSQVYKEKIHDLESKITQLVSATPSLQSIPIPTEDSAALANSQLKITELQEKLITQEKLSEARSAEQLEEEQRLRENVKYLQAQIETLQKELVGKDESLEKFSLSQCGIENLRTELALLKEENEKQAREAEAIYEQKLQAKSEELQQVTNELQKLKSASDSLESERANVSDECEILQTEIRMRDEQIKELSQQLDELTTQLQVQKADSSALDEMLKQQQTGGEEKGAQLKKNIEEIGQLKIEVESSKLKKQELEKELEQTKQETEKDKEILAQQLKEIEQLKANNTELDQELVAKNTELESALKEQQSVKSQLETITEIIAKKDLELKELGQSLVDLNLQLKEKTENCDELLANLDQAKQNAQKSLADKEKELKEAQSQVQKTEESLKLIQNQLEQQQQLSAASGEEGAKQLATLQEEINKVKSQEKELQSALGQSQSELASKIKLLEATNGNLEKLTQTLEDIKKQLAESEEQVKLSSEKYSKKDLQLGDLQRQHEALQGKCDSLNQQQETLQTELVAARSSSSQLQATLKQLNDDLLAQQQDYAAKESQSSGQRLELASDNELLKQSNVKLEQELKEIQDALSKLKAESLEKQTQLTQLEEQSIQKELALGDASRQQENLKERCQALAQQNETLQQQLNALQNSSTDSNAELVKLSQKLVEEQQAKEELSAKSNEERASLESQLQANQQRLDTLCSQVEALTQELALKTDENAQLTGKLKAEQDSAGKQSLELSDAIRKLETSLAKCNHLEQQQEKLQSELQAERTSSNELNSKLLKVSEQISTGQKDLAHQTDVWTKEKLQIESEVQELKQQLQSSQANQEKIQGERQKLETLLQNSQDELAKIQAEQVQLTSGTQETIKDLQERLDITNQDLQHKEQMAREDAQKITDLKTLVEAIQVSNANISATNAELSTILEILQAEKSETAHIFELFEMEADMNAERLIEKLTGMKQELKETHLQLETEQTKYKDLESQLEKLNQSEKNLNEAALDSAEQLRQLQQANGELQDLFKEKQESFAQLEKTLGDTNAQLADQQEKFKQLQQQEMNSHKESTKFSEELEQIQQVREELLKSVQQKEELNQKLESKLKESSDTIKTHQVTCDELQQKLEKLQQKERELLDESTKSKEQLQQLQSANEELQKSLQQKQILLEKGNEFEDRLAEYQKVIDEMDEASSIKTTNIEQLNKRIHDLEMGLQQTIQAHNASQEECKQLSRQLQSLELEKAREVATLKAQVNGTNNASQGQGDEVALADTEISLAKINFLNSIIADMQQKNDALKAKVQTLETLPTDFTKPHAFDMLAKRKPAPRLFCDICDEFDKHETEDCPLQASDDLDDSPPPASEANNNENKERKLPAPRKYCESCEVFGHDTSECADEETY
ncbi:restin homolog isoform X1 [Drosophila willistoni]|uniref:restin homolog isoform X1 n=2 Tax=Drosophila willistoni TaxID=7260 RepID=UPI001F084C56|nr:restin homolog isoform X1 [Drosophila willistoni]